MKSLLSLLTVAAFVASTGFASAMCGHDSAKLQQSVASTTTTAPVEDTEAVSTHDPKTVKPTVSQEPAE